jgi:hypothetical protein
MSFTCQQCGKTTAQLLNYCPKCGAPTPTIALPTAPVMSQETEFDPFETWEPTKQIPFHAVTEALPSAPVATSQLQSQKGKKTSFAHPRTNALSAAPAPATNRWRLIAAVTLGLLITAGDGGYCFTRGANASAGTASVTVAPPVAELQPITAAPAPTPIVENPVALLDSEPAPNNTVAPAKPVRRVRVVNKSNTIVMPSPTPHPYAITNIPTPTVITEKTVVTNKSNTLPTLSLIEQGNRLANRGQLQDAIQVYETARRTNPGNVDVYYLLGLAYDLSGEGTKALEAYRQCTSGVYAAVAANHVKKLGKKHGRTKQDD